MKPRDSFVWSPSVGLNRVFGGIKPIFHELLYAQVLVDYDTGFSIVYRFTQLGTNVCFGLAAEVASLAVSVFVLAHISPITTPVNAAFSICPSIGHFFLHLLSKSLLEHEWGRGGHIYIV